MAAPKKIRMTVAQTVPAPVAPAPVPPPKAAAQAPMPPAKPAAPAPATAKPAAPTAAAAQKTADAKAHYKMIEEAAYFAAQKDGFKRDATAYWLEAERQISGSQG